MTDVQAFAEEIERAHEGAPAIGHAADEPCANCGARRHGPYCHQCGQAGHVHRNLGALVHDLAHGVFHFEGRIWRTLPLLVWRPGELTRRYVAGERVRFVSPMALFLFAVFLMFAAISNTGHHRAARTTAQVGAERARTEAKLAAFEQARQTMAAGGARDLLDTRIADARNRVTALEAVQAGIAQSHRRSDSGLAPADIDTGFRWLDSVGRHALENPDLTVYKMKSYAYKYSWALIPLSLPFLWLLFAFRRDVGLYDHAIFAIYSLSFMSLGTATLVVLSALGLPRTAVVLTAMIVPPVHMYRQLKGAYRLGRFGAGWRTAALLAITAVTGSLFFAFLIYMGSD